MVIDTNLEAEKYKYSLVFNNKTLSLPANLLRVFYPKYR